MNIIIMQFKTLQEFLNHYESLDHFAGYNFTGAINNITKIKEEDILLKKYEARAFGFQPFHKDQDNNRGTYYGPFITYTGEDGNYYESPSISFIDQDCIKYRWSRLESTESSFMKYRYADLIFDFSSKILGDCKFNILPKNYILTTGSMVIDSGIEILKNNKLEHNIDGKTYLERMIDVSIRIGRHRLEEIIQLCLDYEDQITEDESPGLRGFSYDYLMKNKKIINLLTDNQKTKVIKDLEDRLERLIQNNGGIWSIKHCINNLLDYYGCQEDKIIKLLEILEAEYRKDAHKNSSPLLIQHYLEEIKDLYQYHNHGNRYNEKIHALIQEIKEVGKSVNEGLKTVTTEIKITDDEMRQEINKYYDTGKRKIILKKFISGFIHNKNRTLQTLEGLIKNHPILFLSRRVILDENGIVILQLPSPEENIEPHLIQQYQQEISIVNIFLGEVCNYIKNDYTAEDNLLNSEITRSIVKQEIIDILWKHYLEGNNLEFCHIAIPLIEAIFRLTLEKIGGTDIKSNKVGGYDKKSFGDILFDPLLQQTFGGNFIFYYRVLFVERGGLNLRNDLAHGIHIDNFNSQLITNRVFHALICLSIIQFQDIE